VSHHNSAAVPAHLPERLACWSHSARPNYQLKEQSMPDRDDDRGRLAFTRSAPFLAAIAFLALFLIGGFVFFGGKKSRPATGQPGSPATSSTTGGTPAR
jgi:hypothetical protein